MPDASVRDESQTRFPRDMQCGLAIGLPLARSGGDRSVRHQGYHHHARHHPSSILHRVARRRARAVRLYAVRARASPSADSAPRTNLSPVLVSFESISRDDATATFPNPRLSASLDPSTRRPRPTLAVQEIRGDKAHVTWPEACSPTRWTGWRRSSSARRRQWKGLELSPPSFTSRSVGGCRFRHDQQVLRGLPRRALLR